MRKIFETIKKVQEEKLNFLSMPTLPKEFILKSVSDSNIDPRIVAYFDPKSPISEQYKRLRENIKAFSLDKQVKVLAITSAVHNEGKTITALNLAVAMAQDIDCRKVLLVDCDLRRGSIDRSLGFEKSEVGLAEFLLLGADIDNILFKTKIDKLTIIPKGKISENPAELLASAKMKNLMKKLKEKFDFIILDTPPVIPLADAGIIGSVVDGILMVVRSGKTQRGIVKHATEILKQAKSEVLGYVLTHVEYYIPQYIYKYV